MKYRLILEKLLEIERTIGVQDAPTVKRMVIDAEEFILKLQRESIEALHSVDQMTVAYPFSERARTSAM
jgi:hypothetical protein